MIKLGLTGSIGMGKSATANMFRQFNIPVFDADAAVHSLLAEDAEVIHKVAIVFPDVVKEGRIDRTKLGAQVFGKPDILKKLEDILHPCVAEKRQAFLSSAEKQAAKIIVLDVPLLYEKGYDQHCDYVVVVSASAHIQKQRVLERPGMSAEKFNHIIALQTADEIKRQRADFIVQTDQGLEHARAQVEKIIDTLGKI